MVQKIDGGEQVFGVIHAGDFGGHWLSKTDLAITITLTADTVDAQVVAKNVGTENEPMAISWHPYFNFPSGDHRALAHAVLTVKGVNVAKLGKTVRLPRSRRQGAGRGFPGRKLQQAGLEGRSGDGGGDRS